MLVISIAIRLAALVWSLLLLRRAADWRMAFLSLMLALMTTRQGLTLVKRPTADWWHLDAALDADELPGLAISAMAFLAVFFLGQVLIERRRTVSALAASELRFDFVARHLRDVIWSLDASGHFTYVSPSVARLLGFTPGDLVGRHFTASLTAAGGAIAARYFEEVVTGQRDQVRFEVELQTNAGGGLWGEVDAAALRAASGELISVQGVTRDVSARRQTEFELRRSEARYRLLYADATDPIFTLDAEGHVIAQNAAGERLAGYTLAELAETHFIEHILPESRALAQQAYERLLAGETVIDLQYGMRRRDGSPLYLSASLRPVFEDGEVVQIEGIARDVSERRQEEESRRALETQLQQAQKMEAVGTLAGGIAHDFNNLLTGILGGIEIALLEPGTSDSAQQSLRHAQAAAERAAELTRDLLTLSRRREPEMSAVLVNDLVNDTARLLRRSIPKTIEVREALDPSLPPVRGDAGQLQQALLNLAINARDAMPEGGILAFATRRTQVYDDGSDGAAHPERQPGEYLVIEVTDTGTGMDEETLGHAFEPFFTTKVQGKGTGLGLSLVYSCLRAHGGWVAVTSTLGRGARFCLYLPFVEVEFLLPGEREEMLPQGSETVLLVDDTDTVLYLGRAILERCGYRVLTAWSGEEAISVFDRERDAIDIVITDLVMPRSSGRDLLQALRQRGASIPVVLTSGYYLDEAGGSLADFSAFVAKPFNAQRLATVIRQSLDAAAGPTWSAPPS